MMSGVPLETCWAFNPLNAELNPICHLLALLAAHHILHISRIKVNEPWNNKFCYKVAFCWLFLVNQFYNVWQQTTEATGIQSDIPCPTHSEADDTAPLRMRRIEIILYSSVFNYGKLFIGNCQRKCIIRLTDFVIFPGKRTPFIQGCLNILQFVLFRQGIIDCRFSTAGYRLQVIGCRLSTLNQRSWSFHSVHLRTVTVLPEDGAVNVESCSRHLVKSTNVQLYSWI
jgi:hypothetical protein